MIQKLYNLDINIYETGLLNSKAEFVAGDTLVNRLCFNLLNNSRQALDLSDVAYIAITFKKPDNVVVVGDVVIDNAIQGRCSYVLGSQEINIPGTVIFTLEIYYPDGGKLTTPQYTLLSRRTLDEGDAITSTTEYAILTRLILDMNLGVGNEIDGGTPTSTFNSDLEISGGEP